MSLSGKSPNFLGLSDCFYEDGDSSEFGVPKMHPSGWRKQKIEFF